MERFNHKFKVGDIVKAMIVKYKVSFSGEPTSHIQSFSKEIGEIVCDNDYYYNVLINKGSARGYP